MGGMKAVVWIDAFKWWYFLEFAYLYLFWMGFIKANPNFTGFDSERYKSSTFLI
jgi:hypothetical protein